jgi:hypothetical protein
MQIRSRAAALVFASFTLVLCAFAFAWWRHVNYDVSRLVVFGKQYSTGAPCSPPPVEAVGYDGQFYFRLATNPFSFAPVASGVKFDYPAYRGQRILYPLLAFMLSLGNACAAMWFLPLINLCAITAIAWLGIRLTSLQSPASAYGVLAACWPGFLFSFARDLTEPLEVALLILAIVFALEKRGVACGIVLCCAVLTRETALIEAFCFLLVGTFLSIKRRRFDFHAGVALIAIALFFSWKWLICRLWQLPFELGSGNVIGKPLHGVRSLLRDAYAAQSHIGFVQVVELIALLFLVIVVIAALMEKAGAAPLVRLSVIAYFCFAATLTRDIWIDDWAYMRALSEAGCLAGILFAASSPGVRRIGAMTLAGGWIALAFEMLRFR